MIFEDNYPFAVVNNNAPKTKFGKLFQLKMYHTKEYITFTTCGLKLKRSKHFNHGSIKKHLAASREYHYQQCRRLINVFDN